jgi:hypothetical protein
MSFTIDMSRYNLCFKLYLLERGVQVTTYDFGLMDNPTTSQLDRSLFKFESSRRFQFSFTDFSLVYRSAFAQIFSRSQPMRESNTFNDFWFRFKKFLFNLNFEQCYRIIVVYLSEPPNNFYLLF